MGALSCLSSGRAGSGSETLIVESVRVVEVEGDAPAEFYSPMLRSEASGSRPGLWRGRQRALPENKTVW